MRKIKHLAVNSHLQSINQLDGLVKLKIRTIVSVAGKEGKEEL